MKAALSKKVMNMLSTEVPKASATLGGEEDNQEASKSLFTTMHNTLYKSD
jgi:hypothetical protein